MSGMPPDAEAWHEAGHALAAHMLGGRVREVTLESDRTGFEAHAAVEWRCLSDSMDARRMAMVALAGPVAEFVFRGEDLLDDPGALFAWRDDWDEAQAQLAKIHESEEEIEQARRAILVELRKRFDEEHGYECLARIADALDAHETLDEALFLEIVEDEL